MKTTDIKNDIVFFLQASLLCIFWYVIFILADQSFAALFAAICGLLALYSLTCLVMDMIHLMKHKGIPAA